MTEKVNDMSEDISQDELVTNMKAKKQAVKELLAAEEKQTMDMVRARLKADEAEKRKAAYRIEIAEVLANRELYYIQNSNVINEYNSKRGTWDTFTIESMKTRYSVLRKAEAMDIFTDEYLNGRMYNDFTYTFNDVEPTTLNKMRRDHWLTPKKGTVSKWFEYLIQSLGGNKPENMEHIEHVLAWKYLHPEEYQLPCMVIYGQGGVGKNELVNILAHIYGPNQVTATDFASIGGNFNGVLAGKTIVFIDEMADDKTDMNIMKKYVNNRTVTVNEKFVKAQVVDNTALYMTGTNSLTGAIQLAKDSSDRRWSILKVEKNLIDWIAAGEDCTYDEAIDLWEAEGRSIIKSPEHIAVWLHHILTKYKSYKKPTPLHGQDFKELCEVQKTALELVCDNVFLEDGFSHIATSTLYDIYKKTSAEDNPRGYILGKQNFKVRVTKYIQELGLNIIAAKVTWKIAGNKATSTNVYKINDGRTILSENDNHYLTKVYKNIGPGMSEVVGVHLRKVD
jgi:hypothetical protein